MRMSRRGWFAGVLAALGLRKVVLSPAPSVPGGVYWADPLIYPKMEAGADLGTYRPGDYWRTPFMYPSGVDPRGPGILLTNIMVPQLVRVKAGDKINPDQMIYWADAEEPNA